MCNNAHCRCLANVIPVTAVTFADGTLTLNVPAGRYENGKLYKLLLTQELPVETTIYAPVVLTIGEGTVEYPLVRCSGSPVTAASLRSGFAYPVQIAASEAGGNIRVLGNLCCAPSIVPDAIDGTAAAEGDAGGGA